MVRFDIEFKDARGRPVSADEWLECVKREAFDMAIAAARATIHRVRCPIHARRPREIRTNHEGHQLAWSACCPIHEEAIRMAIRRAPGLEPIAPASRSRLPSGARSAG